VQGTLTVLPLLLFAGLFLGYGASQFERVFNPRPFYSEVPDALQVLHSRMNWVETPEGPWLYVTGILTNRSDFAWKELEFECRFFDSGDSMVDAAHTGGFHTILPNSDSAFRVRVKPARSAGDYRSMKTSVVTARIAQSPF
jgi:hypothetical protein